MTTLACVRQGRRTDTGSDDTTATDTSAGGSTGSYTIASGDTLSGIAQRAGVSLDDLVAANGWSDGANHLIVPGDVLELPAGATAGGGSTAAGSDSAGAPTAARADTTYLDLWSEQGRLLLPFSPDAIGGDVNDAEPECNAARDQLSAFGAGRTDEATVLAALEAVPGDLPGSVPGRLDRWQAFVSDHQATNGGTYRPVAESTADEATIRRVLVDPAVVEMLDDDSSLLGQTPADLVSVLDAACTSVEA